MPSFDIIHDEWLDVVRIDNSAATVSLRLLLEVSHQIADISETSPLTDVALLRFLIAVVSDGLKDRITNEDDWESFLEECRHGLPRDAVDSILAPLEGRSNVLDPDHDAFFDAPAIRRITGWDDVNAHQPASRALPEIPTGTNLAHFVHASDSSSAVCVGCLLKSRAVDAAFARGGLGPSLSRNLLASINGMEPRYVVPMGSTLLETLLLNAVVGDDSYPSWRGIHSRRSGVPGPLARLTWRPRLVAPLEDHLTDQPCVQCATVDRPRFAKVIIADTYNHNASPFGSKTDVEGWKKEGGDPHVLATDKEQLRLGLKPNEWPLRALTRVLVHGATGVLNAFPHRAGIIGGPVRISATSSSGNQAKIDDALASSMVIPSRLFDRSREELKAVGLEMTRIFEKPNLRARKILIPCFVTELLEELSEGGDPEAAVDSWLERARTAPRRTAKRPRASKEDDDLRWKVCTQMVRLLGRLSPSEVAALRDSGQRNPAARQAVFEAVWFKLSRVGSGSKRHSLREALATIGPIYAAHGKNSLNPSLAKPGAFASHLERRLNRERTGEIGADGLERLLTRVVTASSYARDALLAQLVDELAEGSGRIGQRIDFVDLLFDVTRWNDGDNPTPKRWQTLLKLNRISAT